MHPREKPGVENERGSSLEIEEDTPWDTRFPLRELALCPARVHPPTPTAPTHGPMPHVHGTYPSAAERLEC